MVIQICNENDSRDDDFDIYLNGTLIGNVNLNQDAQIGSVLIGDTNTNYTVVQPDFSCDISNMVIHRFANTVVVGGNNTLQMINTQQNNNANYGTVNLRNYKLVGNNLQEPCGVADFVFQGFDGANFTFTFFYDQCCEYLITPTPTKTPTKTPTPTPTPTQTSAMRPFIKFPPGLKQAKLVDPSPPRPVTE